MNKAALSASIFFIALIGVIFYATQTFIPSKQDNPLSILSQTPTGFITQAPPQQQSMPYQEQQKQKQAETPPDIPLKASQSATIQTSKGIIVLKLYTDKAPNTIRNFLGKAKSGFYNGLLFQRVEDWVIQGGDPKGDGTGGGSIPVEFNDIAFKVGSLGVASRGDGQTQNDAQFFITKTDASWLNGKYTNFGEVTEGMEVVRKITIGDKINGILFE